MVAALCALFSSVAITARAIPSLDFVDNMDNTVTLQVVLDAQGSVATEIGVEGDLDIVNVSILDFGPTSTWEVENPGANPFTGTVTNGLYSDFANNRFFASFGSGILTPGDHDFLLIEYQGFGTITASGNVAQLGANNPGLSATFTVIPEPTSALLACCGMGLFVARRRRV